MNKRRVKMDKDQTRVETPPRVGLNVLYVLHLLRQDGTKDGDLKGANVIWEQHIFTIQIKLRHI